MSDSTKPLWETGQPGVPALPGQEGTCPPHDDWSGAEQWAWKQIRAGRAANFHEKYGDLDPRDDKAWQDPEVREQRLLSPNFLKSILLHQPWRGALTHVGVCIIGALFVEPINLANADISGGMWLAASRIEKSVDLKTAMFAKSLVLSGSLIAGKLTMDRAVIQGGLFMRSHNDHRAEFQSEMRLLGVQVGSVVDFTGSILRGDVHMDRAVFTGGLFMDSDEHNRAEFEGNVRMHGIQVGGNVEITDSIFKNGLSVESALIKGDIISRGVAINGADANHVQVLGAWVLGRGRENISTITGMNVAGAKFTTIIDGWRPNAGQEYDPWPQTMDMSGLAYNDLHGVTNAGVPVPITARPASWFKNWLGRQKEFSPQPYEQCAKVLRAAGAPDKANAVMFECKQRERRRASVLRWALKEDRGYQLQGGLLDFWKGVGLDSVWVALTPVRKLLRKTGFTPVKPADPQPLRWLWQVFMQWTIGYGIGWRYTWSVGWAALLVGIGIWLCGGCPDTAKLDVSQRLAFSLDMFLPIIELSKTHNDLLAKIPDPWPRWWFYFMKISGYGLAALIIARLAGVGQNKSE